MFKMLNLIWFRALAELKSEASRTYAGYWWWIAEPMLTLAVYYIAFNYVFHNKIENFSIFLFSGIVVFRFFSGTVTRSGSSIINGQGLMQLVYVHKTVFPFTIMLVNLIKFMVTLLLVIVIAWIAGMRPTLVYIALPLLILLLAMVTTGISLICAAITPFFPDFHLILATIIQLTMFLSGVFYDISGLSSKMQLIIRINPLATIIEQFRRVILQGQWPEFSFLTPVFMLGIVLSVVGWGLISKFDKIYPKLS